MPRKVSIVLSSPSGERICCFCGLTDDNELDYGKFHEYDGIVTHYYCLLFSSNMQQKGLDDEGILGFLPGDINKELKRGKKLICRYCKKPGATLGCCNTKCKKIFHFPCGLKAGSLHQYFGEFRSYCIHHRPKQNIDNRVLKEISLDKNIICYICYDEVNPHDTMGTIWAPCCKKNAWFHRICVQQLANSAGYFFKCPLCNNKNEFQRAMLDHGIFIPSQDASWELVPNAFQELLYRHNRCDAEKCICPKGREHTSTNAKWELTLCRTCGSQGIHMACGNLKWGEVMWECNECTSILNKSMNIENSDITTVSRYSASSRILRSDKSLLTDDESSSETDISVGDYPEMPMETMVSSSLNSQSSSYVFQNSVALKRQNSSEKQHTNTELNDSIGNKIVPSKFHRNVMENHENREIDQNNDELPPLTKKPKILDSFVDCNRLEISDDSDDDIIVVSGPSRREPSRSLDNPWKFEKSGTERDVNKNRTEFNELIKHASKIVEKFSRQPINSLTKKQGLLTNSAPIEIDLSDESISTTSLTPIVNPVPAANVIPDVPELKIQISNVTSLAPEEFANVPDFVDHTIDDPTKYLQRITADNPGNQNNLEYASQKNHEHLQIVQFGGVPDSSNLDSSVIYGLTIPGTNKTVPLLISSLENVEPPAAPLQDDQSQNILKSAQSNMSALPASLARLAGPKSRKAAILAAAMKAAAIKEAATTQHSTIQSNDTSIAELKLNVPITHSNGTFVLPKPNNSAIQSNEKFVIRTNQSSEKSIPVSTKLSYSIPLDTVVNDQILLSQPSNNCVEKNTALNTFGSSMKTTKLPVKLINTEIKNPQEKYTKTNINSSSLQKASVSSNNSLPNGFKSSPMSQLYALVKSDIYPSTQTSSKISNGHATLTDPENYNFPVRQVGNTIGKVSNTVGQVGNPAGKISNSVGQIGSQVGKFSNPIAQVGNLVKNVSDTSQVGNSLGKVSNPVKQVGNLIGNISNVVGQSGNLVGKVSNSVEQVSNLVGKVTNPVGKVYNPVGKVDNPVGQVTNSVGKVDNLIGQVSNSVGRVSNLVRQVGNQIGHVKQNKSSSVNSTVTSTNTIQPINHATDSTNIPVAKVNGNTTGDRAESNTHLQKTSNIGNELKLHRIPMDKNSQVPSENCDGDAGSTPCVRFTSDTPTNTKCDGTVATRICQHGATENYDGINIIKQIEEKAVVPNDKCVTQKHDSTECSITKDRNNTPDRTGLINKTINLRDLRFTVCGSHLIKMTLYETYCVNINVKSGSKPKYDLREESDMSWSNNSELFDGETDRYSVIREKDNFRNANNDCEEHADAVTNSFTFSDISNSSDELTNQFGNKVQSNVATMESDTSAIELPNTESNNRGQDELKENRDPVPPFTNLSNNATSSIDRKNKSRLRSGINNHTKQLLNELETQEAIVNENDKNTSRKFTNHDQLLVSTTSKMSYNSWKENSCSMNRTLTDFTEEETNSRNISSERFNESIVKKSTTRVRSIDEMSDEISENYESSVKRPKYTSNDENFHEQQDPEKFLSNNEKKNDNVTTMSYLVNNVERAQSGKSRRHNVCMIEKLYANNSSKSRKRTSQIRESCGEASICCKVSIDLARIRAILANKLSISVNTDNDRFYDFKSLSYIDNRNRRKNVLHIDKFHYNARRKSLSLGNLTINDSSSMRRFSIVTTRKWKSTENLDYFLRRSKYEDNVNDHSFPSRYEDTNVNGFYNISLGEDRRRGYKRKARSFEKHDCVR